MITSIEIAALAAALALAQGQFDAIIKERTAKIESSKASYGYKYADLGAVLDAVRGPLSGNGIAIAAAPTIEIVSEKNDDGKIVVYAKVAVETRLLHSSGQWIANVVRGESADTRPQSIGSAITYLRRYGLMALLGVASEDDDGGAASKPKPAPAPRPSPCPAPKADPQPAPKADPPASSQGAPPAEPAPAPESSASEQGAAPASDDEPKHAWTDGERKAYWRELSRMGYHDDHRALVAFCSRRQRPHPGDMPPLQRAKLLEWLETPEGSETFVAFCAEFNQAEEI